MRSLPILIVAASLLATQAPRAWPWRPPSRRPSPIAASFYTGKWYEIARTPNSAASATARRRPPSSPARATDGFSVRQICRKGSASGAAKTFDTTGRIIAGTQNTRFKMSFLGGLKKQEYWVLDCADDQSWAIMATPGRQLCLAAGARARAGSRRQGRGARAGEGLGYAKLEYPQQPPA
jgi:apolipoprotein D and lipocalin family protein